MVFITSSYCAVLRVFLQLSAESPHILHSILLSNSGPSLSTQLADRHGAI